MKPHYEKIPLRPEQSFRAEEWTVPRFDSPWHFHPEIELTLIVSGSGQRLVGDSMEAFGPGDLVLLGPDVPHIWQSPSACSPASTEPSIATVIQFHRDFLGTAIWQCPEFTAIARLLDRASRGLVFSLGTAQRLATAIRRLPGLHGLPALTSLLDLLASLASATSRARLLCSLNYAPLRGPHAADRINRVLAYANRHLANSPSLTQLASVAAMTPSAFSRYFKRATGRNPSEFLNDLRIEQAARLLRETDLPVTHIGGEIGFTTVTSFNRRFKDRMSTTPRAYRKSFQQQLPLPCEPE